MEIYLCDLIDFAATKKWHRAIRLRLVLRRFLRRNRGHRRRRRGRWWHPLPCCYDCCCCCCHRSRPTGTRRWSRSARSRSKKVLVMRRRCNSKVIETCWWKADGGHRRWSSLAAGERVVTCFRTRSRRWTKWTTLSRCIRPSRAFLAGYGCTLRRSAKCLLC